MGIKMSKALYNGREIGLAEYRESMQSKLRCIRCGVPILYVSGYQKSVGNRQVQVKPYFRLNKGITHKEGCNFVTSSVLKKIYADISDNGIMTKKDEKYFARLQIITEDIEEDKKKNNERQIDWRRKDMMPTKKYISKCKKIAYLETMKKIIKLKEELDTDRELNELLSLQFYDKQNKVVTQIRWKDFYVEYSVERYKYIYNLIKNKKVKHPICFSGEIKEVNNKEGLYIIKFYSLKIKKGEYLSLSIMTHSKEVNEYAKEIIHRSAVVYGCGHHIGKVITQKKENGDVKYYNFSTFINRKEQILAL